uniref:Uncharacterized protein n=1 Tax=Solanum lycopersicum TaxID=4081 RepID=A0A3Q7JGZ6_SOLLC
MFLEKQYRSEKWGAGGLHMSNYLKWVVESEDELIESEPIWGMKKAKRLGKSCGTLEGIE